MIRTSTGISRFPLIRVTRFVSTTRRIFAWIGSGIELISSRKIVPWWAISNFPGCPSVLAPVNAPRSYPNSSLSASSSGIAAQLTVTKGPFARRSLVVDRLGEELLPRSRSHRR